MGLIDTIRKWVDGIENDPLASVEERPRRVWEEFLFKVAREIEAVMQKEMFTPPGGPTYIPREYVVFLSGDDDREWQGDKRRGLEQGLYHVLSERARALCGQSKLAASSFAVELRVDATLNKGEFRVQPVWDSAESGHTMVTSRNAAGAAAIQPEETRSDIPEADSTLVRPRPAELFRVEVWRDGVRQSIVPVTRPEISIGRGSRTVAVDLPLMGDPEVSRHHATLSVDADGKFRIVARGRNPTMVAGREVPREEPMSVLPDQKIEICSYTLRIQPR